MSKNTSVSLGYFRFSTALQGDGLFLRCITCSTLHYGGRPLKALSLERVDRLVTRGRGRGAPGGRGAPCGSASGRGGF